MFWCEHVVVSGGDKIRMVSRSGVQVIDLPVKPYCFVRNPKGEYRHAKTGQPMAKREFKNVRDYKEYGSHLGFESDVDVVDQAMRDMDWKVVDVPKCWLDIEVDTKHGKPNPKKDEILSIGMMFDDGREIFLHRDDDGEKAMLETFMSLMERVGMAITYNGGEDVWETRSFDMPYLAERYGRVVAKTRSALKFAFDRRLRHCRFMDVYQKYKSELGKAAAALPGGHGLDNVARHEFGMSKVEYSGRIGDMDRDKLREYNMMDVKLTKMIDDKYRFSDQEVSMARLINGRLTGWYGNKKRPTMSTMRVVDSLFLKYSHKMGIVWDNANHTNTAKDVQGARVTTPKVGLYESVQNYDIEQMYPSIMEYERISPDKERKLVPRIIMMLRERRWKLKQRYKETGKTEDWLEQYNCKVLANSIYGLFNLPWSRYFDPSLAERITLKGRSLSEKLERVCNDVGYESLYADTDSVFVPVSKKEVSFLLAEINKRMAPYSVEAGEYYDAIIFVGGKSGGTKKRYAGIVDGDLKIVGLEAVRRDYCRLARETQRIVVKSILSGASREVVMEYVDNMRDELYAGKLDAQLILSKGVRSLKEYSTDRAYPPHVRALQQLVEAGHPEPYEIVYVLTRPVQHFMGGEGHDVAPVIDGVIPENINRERYWQRQIKPALDSLIQAAYPTAENVMDHISS